MSARPGACWVVAGAPGAGKTTVAQALASRLDPAPALLDKDTLFEGFVDEVLAAHRRPPGEREGPWYDQHVKRHEYGGMTAAARQIRAAGCPVALVAPFTQQIRDLALWADWVAALGGEPVRLAWVTCDAATLRARLVARGRERDGGKLAAFAEFTARMRLDDPPPVPHAVIDTSGAAEPMAAALARLVDQR